MKNKYLILILTCIFYLGANSQNNVTFQVDMTTVDPTTFTTPEVNGTFNGWCGNCASMSDLDGDNVWDVTIDLANGTYEFKYSADNWTIQESLFSGESCTNGNTQYTNRMLTVSGDTTLPVVCWSSCSGCNSGPSSYNVTFELDMRGVTDPHNTPEVNGDFNSWCGNCWQMTDTDGDSIWQFTTSFSEDTIEWKYSADNWNIQEELDSSLSCITINYDPGAPNGWGFVNRLAVVNSDTIFSSPWESCDGLGGGTGQPLSQIDLPITWDDTTVDYTVTDFGGNSSSLTVDPLDPSNNVMMSDKTSGAQTWAGTTLGSPELLSSIPFVSGSTTISAHVYSPNAGTVVRLKAEDHTDPTKSVETEATTTVANGWNTLVFDFANEAPGTAMIDFSYNYDMLSIFYDFGNNGVGDVYYLDSVAFGGLVGGTAGCTDPLASNYNPLATIDDSSCLYSTTFNVDMNCEPAGSFGFVHLESPYFGWCGGCVPMSDPDGDGVHSVIVDIPLGNFEYKYAVDNFSSDENLIDDMLAGGTCAPITDYSSYANRELLVTAGVSTNDTYGSCDPCITLPPVTTSYTINSGSYYYNPNYLVINVGDTVTWMNDGGYHDVNGNINSQTGVSFGNPVSFYLSPVSGPAVIGSYVFNVAGLYNYDCSIGNHAANGMTGTILVNSLPLSQIDLPITWDDTATVDYTVTDFGGAVSSLSVDPNDSTNSVLMTDKTAGAQSWAGTTLGNPSLASSIPFSSGETIITAKVYSPVSGINIRLKAEDHTNPGISVETEVTLSIANAWTTLVFDFSNEVAGTAPINFANTYDMLSIFYDFGNVPASSTVFYLDSVEFIAGGAITGCTDPAALNYDPLATLDDGSCNYTWTLSQIDLPVSWDDSTVDYTVSDFGGNVSSVTLDPLNPLNNVLMSEKTPGAQTWAGTTLGTPIGFATPIPFISGATVMTAHVYSPYSGITVRLKAEDHTDPTKSVETEAVTTTANGWNLLVFDFANEAPGTAQIDFTYTYDQLSIFYDFGNNGNGDIYYLDSVVFGGSILGVPGCTDSNATNYDPLATVDDGSCTYAPTLSQIDLPVSWDDTTVDYTVSDFGGNTSSVVADPAGLVNNVLQSEKTPGAQTWAGTTLGTASGFATSIPFASGATIMTAHVYSPSAGVTIKLKAEDSNDPTKSVETDVVTTTSGAWESLIFDFANQSAGTAQIDFTYTYDKLSIFYDFGNAGAGDFYYLDSVMFGGSISGTPGCTDPLANNYDSLATVDDGSCTYCSFGCTDPLAFNYDSLATCDDGSCIPFVYGCTDPNAINFYPGANTDDGSCIYAGCTDPLANNYDPIATIDDGSCTYMNCSDPSPTGLSNNWVTDTKAEITWNNMNDSACMVFKYFVRYREVGTLTWTTKSAGVGNGLCNFGLNTTTKTLQNLTSSTTYEYKMKAFYCGGTESNYSSPSQFTTAADCPPMTNLTATTFNGNQSKVRFDWDSTGAYVFARVALRVDTVGANWQTAGGFGVYYPTLTVNKFGLQSGESYRAQGRTFCDSNITSYRSWWTAPIFWTQPGTIRMSGGTKINNLDVYPNPTNDIFNVSFVSEEIQTLQLRVLNIVGEVVYTENLEQFVGEYTKQISIGNNARGVYFLEITDNQGTINKKIIVQ